MKFKKLKKKEKEENIFWKKKEIATSIKKKKKEKRENTLFCLENFCLTKFLSFKVLILAGI